MGGESTHVGGLRAGQAQTSGIRPQSAQRATGRHLGGQSSLPTFFGIRIGDTAAPAASEVTVRRDQAKAVAPAPTRSVGDEQPRCVGGLSYGQRRARIMGDIPQSVVEAMRQTAAAISRLAPEAKAGFPPLARPYDSSFDEVQYQAWLDEILAAARVWQALQDAVEYGDARTSTPAMQATARAAALHDEREWSEYADLVAFYPALPYGCMETACALND